MPATDAKHLSMPPEHLADLKKSGLNEDTIRKSDIQSVPPDQIRRILGVKSRRVNSMLKFPYPGKDFSRYKLFPPIPDENDRQQKYYQKSGSGLHLYIPHGFDSQKDVIRITEGEKKALKGIQEGLNTCGLGGIWNFGKKDNESEVTRLMDDLKAVRWKGKTVELIPDGDFQTKSSVIHAVYRLGSILEEEGANVWVVPLPAASKLDDFLCVNSANDFLDLPRINLDDRIFRPSIIKEKGFIEAIRQSIISSESFIQKAMPTRKMYLKPWLGAGTLSLIYADRGVGKTFLCLAIALSLTRKLSIGKWTSENPAGCLYVDGEMSSEELQGRLRLLSKGITSPRLAPLHILSAEAMQREGWPTPNLADKKWRKDIYEHLRETGTYGVVIFDNLASLTPGIDENDKKEWDEINQWLLSLRWMGIAVILVHHAGKSGTQRGTSGREDNLDASIKLSRPRGYRPEDGAKFEITFEKARGVYGEGALPFCLQFMTVDGSLVWTTESVGSRSSDIIIALCGNKIKQKDIAKALGCNPAWVSRIKKKAVDNGLLDQDEGFTEEGKAKYGHIDVDDYLTKS